MSKRQAEGFERALQQAERGEPIEPRFQPLVQIALQAAALAEPAPPPPYGLSPGRQRFLAEAGQLRVAKGVGPRGQTGYGRILRTVAALTAIIVFAGLVFGGGQVVAESLPGELLYGVKLAAEEIRLDLTTDPQARANLTLAQAEERLDEIVELMVQGRAVDDPALAAVQEHLTTALHTAAAMEKSDASAGLQRMEESIQLREQTMTEAMVGLPQVELEQIRQILRAMEQVRLEAHTGQGDPEGLRQRLRHGTPTAPASRPQSSSTPQPSPSPEPSGGDPTAPPGSGPGVRPSPTRTLEGYRPTETAGQRPGPGPQPTHQPTEPSRQRPDPQSTHEPTEPSRQGPGPQPTDRRAGPSPTYCPSPTGQPSVSPSPTPEPGSEPGSPEPTRQPEPTTESRDEPDGPGPGPRPPEKPDQPDPPDSPGPKPPGGDGDGGKRKP